MPYKVIVVGFDRSERGAIAVDEALRLARDTGATLHAVHVVHPSVLAGAANSHAFQAAIDTERQDLEASRQQLEAEATDLGVPVEFHVSGSTDIPDAILATAESVGADLVVVGNHGMTGRARFLLGSIPNKVAHHSPCSVLIVRTEPT
jgi:nucleotide-binding universal stress UspA family protein